MDYVSDMSEKPLQFKKSIKACVKKTFFGPRTSKRINILWNYFSLYLKYMSKVLKEIEKTSCFSFSENFDKSVSFYILHGSL